MTLRQVWRQTFVVRLFRSMMLLAVSIGALPTGFRARPRERELFVSNRTRFPIGIAIGPGRWIVPPFTHRMKLRLDLYQIEPCQRTRILVACSGHGLRREFTIGEAARCEDQHFHLDLATLLPGAPRRGLSFL